MAMLGDLLAAARASSASFQPWLEAADRDLAAAVAAAAARERLSVAGFVRVAVADFSRFAAEEDWVTLLSSLRDDVDPGTACLVAMVHWRLTVGGCGDHSFTQQQHHAGARDERHGARPAG